MGASGEGNSNETCSEKLLQKEEPYIGVHELKTNEPENNLSKLPEEASGQPQRRQSPDFRTQTTETSQAESDVPTTCEKVLCGMQQRQKHDRILASQPGEEEFHACALPQKESENLQQKLSSETGSIKLESNRVSSELKVEPNGLEPRQRADAHSYQLESSEEAIHGSRSHAKQSVQDSVVPKEGSHGLKQEQIPDGETHKLVSGEKPLPDSHISASQFNQVSIIPKIEKEVSEQGQSYDTGISSPAAYEGEESMVVEKASNTCLHSESSATCISTSPCDQEKLTYSVRPEKTLYKLQPRRNPECGVNLSESEHGSNSCKMPEKGLDDGFNWRKYGQKLVRGNVFVRSYHKCTYANCQAKKQVERSHDGLLTDIKYIGKHEHPKPQNSPQISAFVPSSEVKRADVPVMAKSEVDDEPSVAHPKISQPNESAHSLRLPTTTASNNGMGFAVSRLNNSHDDFDSDGSPNLKRQKRETSSFDANLVKKTYCESRLVVQTMSEVDLVNDGYRWRKYGQKLVKGNPNPRSYYRCSNVGCPVKKHVERASHDPKVVITTYEGKHDHDMPASRTISHSAGGSDINGTTMNGEPRSELGDHKSAGLDMVVHIGAN